MTRMAWSATPERRAAGCRFAQETALIVLVLNPTLGVDSAADRDYCDAGERHLDGVRATAGGKGQHHSSWRMGALWHLWRRGGRCSVGGGGNGSLLTGGRWRARRAWQRISRSARRRWRRETSSTWRIRARMTLHQALRRRLTRRRGGRLRRVNIYYSMKLLRSAVLMPGLAIARFNSEEKLTPSVFSLVESTPAFVLYGSCSGTGITHMAGMLSGGLDYLVMCALQ